MRVLISCGGTAGHINPAIAIAKKLKAEETLFVGTKTGMERELVKNAGFNIKFVSAKGLKRKISPDAFSAVIENIKGILESFKLLKEFKPDIVIGTGGYVCGPVLFCAALKKIPTLVHDSNALPGVTVKILSRFVDIVALGFDEAELRIKKAKKIIVTGNPIREELLTLDKNKAKSTLSVKNLTILIMGGSLGAEKINNAAENIIKKLKGENITIIWGTGKKYYDKTDKNLASKNIRIVPYIEDINMIAACDIIICRCGAMTISEICVLGKCAVLIPSPNVTDNHQEFNAAALEKNNAAIVIKEKDLNSEALYNTVYSLIENPSKIEEISKNSSKMGVKDATERICRTIKDLVNKKL